MAKDYSENISESGFTRSPTAVTLTDKNNIVKGLCLHTTLSLREGGAM